MFMLLDIETLDDDLARLPANATLTNPNVV